MGRLRGRADGLARDNQLHTSILLSSSRRIVGRDWLAFTESCRPDSCRRNALRDEIRAH